MQWQPNCSKGLGNHFKIIQKCKLEFFLLICQPFFRVFKISGFLANFSLFFEIFWNFSDRSLTGFRNFFGTFRDLSECFQSNSEFQETFRVFLEKYSRDIFGTIGLFQSFFGFPELIWWPSKFWVKYKFKNFGGSFGLFRYFPAFFSKHSEIN